MRRALTITVLIVAGLTACFLAASCTSSSFAHWFSETALFEALPAKLQDAYVFSFGLLNEI